MSFFSLVFLIWAGPYYSLVLTATVLLNWFFGLLLSQENSKTRRKLLFILILALNLLPLISFKYLGFITVNLNIILSHSGFEILKVPHWLLPLGISFYTFRLLSYQIELFRKKVSAERNLVLLFLYSAFFPQLGAGPIVRYQDFSRQILSRNQNLGLFSTGLQRFMLGLGKKVLIADNLGMVADAVFHLPCTDLTLTTSWFGIISYFFQVYYDFSAYTDMAIGLSRMAGFHTPENFNYPYTAVSVKDFWRRWHMTLTSWFRDYLFLPLAYFFSRKLPARRYFYVKTDHIIYATSIIITWTLVGLWHGASWTFIAWGLIFGIFLILEQLGLGKRLKRTRLTVQRFYTMAVVIFAWVFFRSSTFHQGYSVIRGMTGLNGLYSNEFEYYRYITPSYFFILIIAIAGAAGWLNKSRMLSWKKILNCQIHGTNYYKPVFQSGSLLLLLLIFFLAISEILKNGYTPFIYFQF
ncbi:MAG: MBOAT family protein [Bacteroidales bacterium]